MARLKNPSHDDIFTSRTEAPKAAKAVVQALAEASKLLRQIAAQDHVGSTEIVAALSELKAGQHEVNRAALQLAGLAVSGGAAISTTAIALGMRPETLGRRLAAIDAGRRGETR